MWGMTFDARSLCGSICAFLLLTTVACETSESPGDDAGGGQLGGADGAGGSATGGKGGNDEGGAGGGEGGGGGSGGSNEGGAPEDHPSQPDLVIGELTAPFAIAASDDRIFWSDQDADNVPSILACSPDDCEATIATVVTNHDVRVRSLKYADGKLFWAGMSGVYGCDPDACTPEELTAGDLDVRSLVTDGTVVFYSDASTQSVYRVTSGSEPVVIATDVEDVRGMHFDAGWLYFSTYGLTETPPRSRLFRCPEAGCDGPAQELQGTTETLGAVGVTVADNAIYWASTANVHRCPDLQCNGEAELVYGGQATFEGLAAYDDAIAWSSYGAFAYTCERASCESTITAWEVGSLGQDIALSDTHIYVVASSAPGDGRIARIPR